MAKAQAGSGISRRTLLVSGGAGAGLLLLWKLWPQEREAGLRTADGETAFNAYLKVGNDGRVIVAVPQVELGQGVYTSLPQILADELGADWRTVAVEPAPVSPYYANRVLAEEEAARAVPSAFEGLARWARERSSAQSGLMMTGGSSSIRAFEAPLREAGAAARVLLVKAAAERWNADWEELDTAAGFVVHRGSRLSFGELAEEAASFRLPDSLPMRGGAGNRLVGQALPRIDLPAKVDGSARFAADVRLPDMVYAAVRAGPIGNSRLVQIDRAAAERVPGVLSVFENAGWAGAVATNWWAANRAVEALKPVFETSGGLVSTADMDVALAEGMEAGEATRLVSAGETETAFIGGSGFSAHYSAAPAASAALETLCATARVKGDTVEVWAPAQSPSLARSAAALAAGVGEEAVTFYPMLAGGGYGRKLETAAIVQAVTMAASLKRPVQLTWSRLEEMTQDRFRAPALARLSAKMEGGRIAAFASRIAAPGDAAAVAGAAPPYAVPAVMVDHVPVDTRIPIGPWRSGARSYTTFFTESFIDEIARQTGIEPLSFRMQMLGENPRLARTLTTAATIGGWDGGVAGGGMGLACHSAHGSHAAVLAEVSGEGGRIRVERAVCAVDCGRVINPEIIRQQIEGGLIYGMAAALGRAIGFEDGLPTARTLGSLDFLRLAGSPEISVEIVESEEDPGGITELAVPLAAPAIANAVFAATGQRLRSLPLAFGAG
jgi:isoquinoline 1-oxidoreductase beta subunit